MSIFSRIFRRQPQPPAIVDRRNMNEDWRVGDLAVCTIEKLDWHMPQAEAPGRGDLLRVTAIGEAVGNMGGLCYWLGFIGKAGTYACTGFRKVRPDHKAEDSEISRRIKACKPVKMPA